MSKTLITVAVAFETVCRSHEAEQFKTKTGKERRGKNRKYAKLS